jgi:hypothetical protein
MIKLLSDEWNLSKPKLILSVTGGADLESSPEFNENFRKNILKIISNIGKLSYYFVFILF